MIFDENLIEVNLTPTASTLKGSDHILLENTTPSNNHENSRDVRNVKDEIYVSLKKQLQNEIDQCIAMGIKEAVELLLRKMDEMVETKIDCANKI